MGLIAGLRCLVCGATHAPADVDYVCPDHGDDGTLDVLMDLTDLRGRPPQQVAVDAPGMWRYRAVLSLPDTAAVSPLRVGDTPICESPRLAEALGVGRLTLKDEGVQPTGSLKDRASALAVALAAQKGIRTVATASTGNAAAALAGISASVGHDCVILVPAGAPAAKIAQVVAYGATVVLVEGSYDDAYALCLRGAERLGWYNRSTGFNPYMTEGKKTVVYELIEQLGFTTPDVIAVSVGDGCIIGAVHKGLVEMHELGWIDRIPRLLGVQAEGSAFLTQAWLEGADPLTAPPIEAVTVADSIAAGLPRDRLKAMRAVRDSQGAFIAVPDAEILDAVAELGRTTGVFAEPAGAAAIAGIRHAVGRGLIGGSDHVAVLVTGSGLKDPTGVTARVAQMALRCPPSLDALQELLGPAA